ncbi:MAG: hypothetical protein HYZ54_01490 [Ignavibacteriae bacterium]|nr:hypothetical protein [Ignavibacteriota bacterium]
MSFILNYAYTAPKRLEVISRRFVFIVMLLISGYSDGYATHSISLESFSKQVLQSDFPLDYKQKTITIDSTDKANYSAIIEIDSLKTSIEDTVFTEIADSTEESDTLEPKWSAGAGINFKNQQLKNGVDLSGGKPVIGSSVDISHAIGLGLSFNSAHRLENGGATFQDLSIGLNYTYEVASWVDLSVDVTRYKYSSDTTNALAAQTGSISLTADFYFEKLILDFSLDRYLGTDKQTYFTFASLYLLKYHDLRITPLASISAVTYQIETKRTKIKKGTTQSVTKRAFSLSSILASVAFTYPIYSGFSAKFTPAFVYSPLDDLSSKHSQVIATLGISYSIDF